MACICHFLLFLYPAKEPSLGISGMGSFPVWSGGSLNHFQLFRCRNLALNRFFLLFLEAGMLHTCGVSGHPHLHMPSTFVCPICLYAPKGVDTPQMFPTLLSICMFSEASACCGGCRWPLTCWTPPLHLPLYGGASPYVLHPTY